MKLFKKMFFVFMLLILVFGGAKFSDAAEWLRVYGKNPANCAETGRQAKSIQQTDDGGYIIAGSVYGSNGSRVWVAKLDGSGNMVWEKAYGDAQATGFANYIRQTPDGGYIVGAVDYYAGGGWYGMWVLKLDAQGEIVWQKTYGGDKSGPLYQVQPTSDGGFIIAGQTYGNVFPGYYVAWWIIKTDEDGEIEWEKIYGGGSRDQAQAIRQTPDGGYIVAGLGFSFGRYAGYGSVWVVRLNASGSIIWQKYFYADINNQNAYDVALTEDGGYIVAGNTRSFGVANNEAWIIKLNSSGNVVWEKTYGTTGNDDVYSLEQTSDGNYILAGDTEFFGSGSGNNFWVFKLDTAGAVIWEKIYGNRGANDCAYSVQETSDGGYVAAGFTNSFDNSPGALIVKLDNEGNIGGCSSVHSSSVTVSGNHNYSSGNTAAQVMVTQAAVTKTAVSPDATQSAGSIICGGVPLADAGTDQVVYDSVILDGSASHDEDGSIVSYSWDLTHRTDAAESRTAYGDEVAITGLAPGFYDVVLTVQDNDGFEARDTMLLAASGPCDISTTTTTVPPTLIELSAFDAEPQNGKVLLQWGTDSEVDNTGFNIWRAEGFKKINEFMIPARGSSVEGARYDYLDLNVLNLKPYVYLLEDIDNNGMSTFHGPVKAVPRALYGLDTKGE